MKNIQVTDNQIEAYRVKTGPQRMDSTQVAANIRRMGRVQLLVEVLQRVHRMLYEGDQERYADAFGAYLKGHAGQYVYRMKKDEIDVHLQQIGEFMQRLLVELQPVYQVLERVFGEHFELEQQQVVAKRFHIVATIGVTDKEQDAVFPSMPLVSEININSFFPVLLLFIIGSPFGKSVDWG